MVLCVSLSKVQHCFTQGFERIFYYIGIFCLIEIFIFYCLYVCLDILLFVCLS